MVVWVDDGYWVEAVSASIPAFREEFGISVEGLAFARVLGVLSSVMVSGRKDEDEAVDRNAVEEVEGSTLVTSVFEES
jgi:hypothetical protein